MIAKVVCLLCFLSLLSIQYNLVFVSAKIWCIRSEREALLEFRRGFVTDIWGQLLTWGREDECCNWAGVQCSNTTGHVILLHVSGLRGEISPALLQLHHLTSLYLRGWTNFGGSRIPEFIGFMKTLRYLSLINCNLSGVVGQQLGNLTNLVTLDLRLNQLSFENLNWLSNLSTLTRLDLSDNNVSDVNWPQHILMMRSLKDLRLSYCQLTDGTTPSKGLFVNSSSASLSSIGLPSNHLTFATLDWLFNIKSLVSVDLSSNQLLEGTISEATFKKLHNLKSLDLSFNAKLQISPIWNPPSQLEELLLENLQLSPQFPRWLQTLRNLSRLDLSHTGISDEMPKWFWNFSTTLSSIMISHNEISGTIPDIYLEDLYEVDVSSNAFFGSLPLFPSKIKALQLSQNKISGSIASICKLHSLKFLDISYNQFSGELPTCWKNMTWLQTINLGDNNFSGKIPRSLGSLYMLEVLHLDNNGLSGELPSTLKNCRNLQLIDVGGNKLMGNIPRWIGANYTNMQYLIFRDNRFFGIIPLEICYLTNIQVLDLSMNNLSGKVPTCFNNFTSLAQMDETADHAIIDVFFRPESIGHPDYNLHPMHTEYAYVLVQWKGKQLEYRKILRFLKLIDLSSNKLAGNIPGELFHLKWLVSLNLSRNSFGGNIPPNIGNIERLESLDLSRNHLSGTIPIGLAQLHYLQVLDLSHNHFSGEIPTSTQLQSFNESAYDGNAQLCGRPLALCPGDSLSPLVRPKENDEEGNWLMNLSLVQELGISMVFGFIFGFWGLIGPLLLKRSWRIEYFNFFGGIGDWMYVKTVEFLAKFR